MECNTKVKDNSSKEGELIQSLDSRLVSMFHVLKSMKTVDL